MVLNKYKREIKELPSSNNGLINKINKKLDKEALLSSNSALH